MKNSILASIIMGSFALSATNAMAASYPTSGDFSSPAVQDWANTQELWNADVQNQITTNRVSAEQTDQQTRLMVTNNTNEIIKNDQLNRDVDQQQATDIARNTQGRFDQQGINNSLEKSVTKAQNTGDDAQSRANAAYSHSDAAYKSADIAHNRANDAYTYAETNHQALQATNHRVADNSAAIADHEQRIEKLEASNNANFGKLKNEVDDNRQRASAAISGVAAMANIPQVIQGQTFSVGAGVGTTDGESALAVGFSARAAEHVVVKASVSDDTQQNFVVGGGVSYGW